MPHRIHNCTNTLYDYVIINRLTPNDPYRGRTAPLTSKRCILYICSTNIGTEYFKHSLYSPSFSLQNAVCFIMLTCLVLVLFTFYIQDVLKLKKNNSSAKGLIINTYVSLMYELKKMESDLRVNLLGPGHRLMKKEFTGPRSHKFSETLF